MACCAIARSDGAVAGNVFDGSSASDTARLATRPHRLAFGSLMPARSAVLPTLSGSSLRPGRANEAPRWLLRTERPNPHGRLSVLQPTCVCGSGLGPCATWPSGRLLRTGGSGSCGPCRLILAIPAPCASSGLPSLGNSPSTGSSQTVRPNESLMPTRPCGYTLIARPTASAARACGIAHGR